MRPENSIFLGGAGSVPQPLSSLEGEKVIFRIWAAAAGQVPGNDKRGGLDLTDSRELAG
jgi:hypothetical protein